MAAQARFRKPPLPELFIRCEEHSASRKVEAAVARARRLAP
jgi:hypothetical protein